MIQLNVWPLLNLLFTEANLKSCTVYSKHHMNTVKRMMCWTSVLTICNIYNCQESLHNTYFVPDNSLLAFVSMT
jgi:hypothetical protein